MHCERAHRWLVQRIRVQRGRASAGRSACEVAASRVPSPCRPAPPETAMYVHTERFASLNGWPGYRTPPNGRPPRRETLCGSLHWQPRRLRRPRPPARRQVSAPLPYLRLDGPDLRRSARACSCRRPIARDSITCFGATGLRSGPPEAVRSIVSDDRPSRRARARSHPPDDRPAAGDGGRLRAPQANHPPHGFEAGRATVTMRVLGRPARRRAIDRQQRLARQPSPEKPPGRRSSSSGQLWASTGTSVRLR